METQRGQGKAAVGKGHILAFESLCTEQKGEQDPSMIRVRVRGTAQRPASHFSLELERNCPCGWASHSGVKLIYTTVSLKGNGKGPQIFSPDIRKCH